MSMQLGILQAGAETTPPVVWWNQNRWALSGDSAKYQVRKQSFLFMSIHFQLSAPIWYHQCPYIVFKFLQSAMFESPSQPVHLNPNEHSNEANALPGLSRGAHVRTPKGPKGKKNGAFSRIDPFKKLGFHQHRKGVGILWWDNGT